MRRSALSFVRVINKMFNEGPGMRLFALLLMASLFTVTTCFDAVGMQMFVPFDQVVKNADLIFVGKAVSQTSRYGPNQKMILTDVVFEVERHIHKKHSDQAISDTVTLTFAGGEKDGHIVRVSDVPEIELGAEYIIFTIMDGRTYASPIIGSSQGLFHIMRDETTGIAYPLSYGGKRPLASIDADHHLMVGPPVSKINNGLPEKAAEDAGKGYFEVAPVPVFNSSAAKARQAAPGPEPASTGKPARTAPAAFVRPMRSVMPEHIMDVDEFIAEVMKRI